MAARLVTQQTTKKEDPIRARKIQGVYWQTNYGAVQLLLVYLPIMILFSVSVSQINSVFYLSVGRQYT